MRDDIRRVRQYELMTILTPELPDEDLRAALTRVEQIVGAGGGTVTLLNRETPWGRRRLAYPIRHGGRDVRDGFYALFYVDLETQSVVGIERDLKLMDNLMRYLITQQVAEPMIPQSELDAAEEHAAEEAAAAGVTGATMGVSGPDADAEVSASSEVEPAPAGDEAPDSVVEAPAELETGETVDAVEVTTETDEVEAGDAEPSDSSEPEANVIEPQGEADEFSEPGVMETSEESEEAPVESDQETGDHNKE